MQQLRKVMIEKNKLYDTLFPEENKEKSNLDIQNTDISQIIIHSKPKHHNLQEEQNSGEESCLSVISVPMSQKSHNEYPVQIYNDKEDTSDKPDDDPIRTESAIATSNTTGNPSQELVGSEIADRST
jgi:hypothetical protein